MKTSNPFAFPLALHAATIAMMLMVPSARAANFGEAITPLVEREYASLEKLYIHCHTHPELSFREQNTAARLAEELKALGLEVTTGVGGHGVVGVLKNGIGPTLLVRTDLDALPLKELTGLPYASTVRTTNDLGAEVDVMHACGHDIHITSLVGTARVLTQLKERWSGTLVFIGQPAEERGAGARAMLKDGLFTRFPKPDFCLALHVSSDLAAGSVGVVEGFVLANVDSVDITLRGAGGHGAWPHKTKDPIVLAAQSIMAMQTIVSRETDPLESAVVTVGSVHGGTKHNIIPDEVKLQLTVRSFTDEVRARTLDAIRRIVRGQAISAGIPEDRLPVVQVDEREFTPATYNNPELARRVGGTFKQLFGEKKVISRRPVMGGEDFSEYGRTEDKIPICIFWLGSVEAERVADSERTGKPLPALHSSLYRPVPEPTIKTGVTAMSAAVLELLGKEVNDPRARLGFLALIGGATGIGFAPVLVKMSQTGPTATAFYRLLFALPLIWLWATWDRRQHPAARQPATRRDFLMLAMGGLLFTADLSIWHWSLQFTTVTNSTLLTNVAPIFVTIGALFLFGDRIKFSFLLGMMLAICGAVMLVKNSVLLASDSDGTGGFFSSKHLLGDILSIVAAFFYAGYLLAVKHLRKTFSTPTIMAWSGLASCAGFGLVALLSGDKMLATSGKGWGVLIALAVISHAGGQTLIAYGFGHLPASFSSVTLLWQPVVAAVVAWLVLGETLTWLQGAGAVVVLSGIAVAGGILGRAPRGAHLDTKAE